MLVALAFCGYGLVSQWSQITAALTQMTWWGVLGALVCALAGLFTWLMAWRSLLAGFGAPLPLRAATRVMFLAQLGKYVPGSVWALVGQVELGRRHDVPRDRGAGATMLAMATTVATGCAVAAATLPLASPEATSQYWWLLPLAPVLLACLHPRVVTVALNRVLRLIRRPPLPQAISLGATVRAVGWTLAGWALFGAHLWLLAGPLGGVDYLLATGAYTLAFVVGFLVIIAPGGLGAREAALVLVLSPALGAAPPLVLALASRVVLTAADLLWASAAYLLGRRAGVVGSGAGQSADGGTDRTADDGTDRTTDGGTGRTGETGTPESPGGKGMNRGTPDLSTVVTDTRETP
ncbi:MAG TPA: lysylphosphatidylglycerol synthase transmembrane domain-containing protein [Streptosporangiaceae bacterium]|nr:lysylphosphatidylglycerol synthase transmembrane domain-containing protein [Streptosporangiaceae bacterium]